MYAFKNAFNIFFFLSRITLISKMVWEKNEQTKQKHSPTPTPTCGYFPQTDHASWKKGRKEMFDLMMHSTHFIYVIWHQTYGKGPHIVREETCCHVSYSFRLAARVLLYASYHRQDNTYHGLCYTSRGARTGMRNSSVGPP